MKAEGSLSTTTASLKHPLCYSQHATRLDSSLALSLAALVLSHRLSLHAHAPLLRSLQRLSPHSLQTLIPVLPHKTFPRGRPRHCTSVKFPGPQVAATCLGIVYRHSGAWTQMLGWAGETGLGTGGLGGACDEGAGGPDLGRVAEGRQRRQIRDWGWCADCYVRPSSFLLMCWWLRLMWAQDSDIAASWGYQSCAVTSRRMACCCLATISLPINGERRPHRKRRKWT